jgi:hypothetical protein
MNLVADLFFVLVVLCWVTLVGWAITRLFCASLSLPEILGWSFACGLLFQARFYEALLLARARPRAGYLLAAGGVVLLLSLVFRRGPALSPEHARPRSRAWALAVALSVPWLLFVLESIAEPMWATDFLAIWGLKAKTIFLSASIPGRLFHDSFTFWSHPEYPLLLPLSLSSLAAVVGKFDDQALALLYPAFEAATLFLLFGHLRRRVSFAAGAVAVVLAAFCFPLYRASNAGTGEIPLAFAFVLAATACLDAMERDTGSARLRLLIASHLCATFKQEGALLPGLLALALLIRWLARRGRSSPIPALCLLLPAAFHMAALRVLAGSIPRRDFDFTLLAPGRWSEWIGRCLEVFRHLFRVELAAAALPAAALVLFLLSSRRRREDILLPVLIAQGAAYAIAASLSAFGPAWALESAFSRTTIALVPALVLVLGARAGALFSTSKDREAADRVRA